MMSSSDGRLSQNSGSVILALPQRFLNKQALNDLTHFYDRLERDLVNFGARVERQPVNRRPFEKLGNCSNLIILHNGARCLPNVLNTGQSYIPGFWNIDRKGVRGMSGIGDMRFVPETIDGQVARDFCDDLRRTYVETRRSIYRQVQSCTELPVGSIAVFLQGDNSITRRTMRPGSSRMLKVVAENSAKFPIVVKHHPLKTSARDVQTVKDLLEAGHEIIETDANVHDILRTCSVTVSISSGACFEGFLHGKPAIFFGKTDLREQAYLANDDHSFCMAFEQALDDREDYDKFVFWYLKRQCISSSHSNLAKVIMRKAKANGFDIDMLT